jgi:hypothetical protein
MSGIFLTHAATALCRTAVPELSKESAHYVALNLSSFNEAFIDVLFLQV